VLLAGGLLVSGCAREDSEPFRIAANIWPGYEPLHLAAKLGYFAPLPVTVHEMPSSSASLHAFRNRTVDAAALTLDETLLLAQDGIDLRIILILDVSNGADVLMARPEITQPAELRGRRIGVENTALGAYVLSRALEQAGLLPTEVQVVSLTVDRHEEAYLTGEVDAVVTFEPVRTKLLDRGARILFDSRRLPDEILEVLVTQAEVVRERPQAVRSLVDGWFRALDFLRNDPARAAAMMARRQGLAPAAVRDALTGLRFPDRADNERLLNGPVPGLLAAAARLEEVMLRHHLLQRAIEPSTLLAHPEKRPP